VKLTTELSEAFGIAFSAVCANKMRAILTTLGIVIGIVSVSVMNMAVDGISASFIKSISALGSDVFYIDKTAWVNHDKWWKSRGRRDITMQEAKQLSKLLEDRWQVSPYAQSACKIVYDGVEISGVMMDGGTPIFAEINSYEMIEGRYFTDDEVDGCRPVCALGYNVADKLFKGISPLGKYVKLNGVNYQVIGVMEKRGTFMGFEMDSLIYIPVTRLLADFAWRPNVSIAVKPMNRSDLDENMEEVRGAMRRVRQLQPADDDDFAINKQETLVNMFNTVCGIISAVGLFISGLSLFVGGIGIMNIMFVSVAERTKEIGLRKALGAKRRIILTQFLMESSIICLMGGIVGLLIAWSLKPIVNIFMPASISIGTVCVSLAISVMV